ncbi:hypothetical protein [Halioxenophilus aromaticivorans]|uniref:hypothetical protein n=1 Tax=Halioxenophilus aromaticivorans TaxID=1306992 RepID=UPI0031EA02D9
MMLVAFSVQAIVPVGYMPGSLFADGGYIKFCPAGVSDAVMAIVHHNHAKSTHSDANHVDDSVDTKHNIGNTINKDHTAHHSDGPFHNHHNAVASDVSHAKVFSDAHKDEPLETAWQPNCDYGFIKSSTDNSLPAFQFTPFVSKAVFEQQRLRYQDVIATIRRKQQPRAPPIFS